MVNPVEKKVICYFCDESSQNVDEWLAVGGIAVSKNRIPEIVQKINSIKQAYGRNGEIKWSNSKSFRGVVHKAFIDYLFDLIGEGKVHFHIRFSRMSAYDHGLSGERKKIDTVSKSFYQLLLHRAIRFYHEGCLINIYPDDGECTRLLPEKITPLHVEGRRNFPLGGDKCVNLIQCRSSAVEPMLQLLDVTLGALAAYRNGRHERDDISEIKRELARYAFMKTGWEDIGKSCPLSQKKLNLWSVTPKFKRGR